MQSISLTSIKLPYRLIKKIVMAGILLVCLFIGIKANDIPIPKLLIGLGALVYFIIAVENIPLAVTILVATSATVNITFAAGGASPIPFSLLVCVLLIGVWLLRMVMVDKKIYLTPQPYNLPFLGFILALFISWLTGYVIWDQWVRPPSNLLFVQIGQIAIYVLSIGTLFLIANQSIQEKYLRAWTLIIAGIGAFTILYRIFITPLFANNLVTYAIINWPFILIWGQLLFNPKLKLPLRVGGYLISLAWIYWVMTQSFSWKGGFLPALMALAFMAWFKNKKLFLTLMVVFSLLLLVNWAWFNQEVLAGEVQSGSGIRLPLWWDVVRMTLRSPLLGLGPVNYKFYWQDPNFFPISRLSNWDAWNDIGYSPPSHNMFVDIFAQTGLIGFGLFLWGALAALKKGLKITQRCEPGFQRAYVLSVVCGFASFNIASFVFADLLMPFFYNLTITQFRSSIYSWILLGSIFALDNTNKGGHDE